MLEKNKDYVEFTLQYTSVDCGRRSKDCPEVCLKGYSDFSFPGVPIMDVVCNEFDHKVVVVSKRVFDRLQADNQHYRELAKQREENYKALLDKTGFDTVESLVFYLTNVGQCDTLLEALAHLRSEKYTCDEWKGMRKKLEECEKDYISERDKAETYAKCIDDMEEACQSYRDTIEDLKKKLAELETPNKDLEERLKQSPLKEVMRSRLLYDHHPWSFRNVPIEEYLAKRGFTCVAEAIDNLDATVKSYRDMFDGCEPAYVKQRIDEMKDEIENLNKKLSEGTHIVYLNDPLGVIARWERVTGYDSPKAFLKWKADIEGIIEAWKDGTGCKYPGDARRLLEKWQTMTRSETPENAAKWIEKFKETDKRCDKLAREVESWKNAIGYSTPEDYLQARINFATPFDYTAAWQKSTGCLDPEAAKQYIDRLKGRLNKIYGCSVDW